MPERVQGERGPQETSPLADRTVPAEADDRSHPAVRNYVVLCLLALMVLALGLVDYAPGWWALVPVLAGAIALVARWNVGPPFVLLSLACILMLQARWPRWRPPTLSLSSTDIVMGGAVLAYVVGQYRLLSLVRQVFPRDTRAPALPNARRQQGGAQPAALQRRSPVVVSGRELIVLALSLPVWCLLAALAWKGLESADPLLDIRPGVWQTLLVLWVGGLGLTMTAVVLGYLGWSGATPEASRLYLQDQLWRETRTEQGEVYRWLAWARRKRRERVGE
jgi:hypothetical protein